MVINLLLPFAAISTSPACVLPVARYYTSLSNLALYMRFGQLGCRIWPPSLFFCRENNHNCFFKNIKFCHKIRPSVERIDKRYLARENRGLSVVGQSSKIIQDNIFEKFFFFRINIGAAFGWFLFMGLGVKKPLFKFDIALTNEARKMCLCI